MEKVNEKVKKQRLVMLICLLIFPIGVVFIVIGATHNIIPLPIIGAVMSMLGFYGGPISIVVYAKYRMEQKVMGAIIEKNANSVSAIARETGKNEGYVQTALLNIRKSGWLEGYYIVGEKLADGKTCEGVKKVAYKCDGCGASFVWDDSDAAPRCPYCGNYQKNK